MIYLDTHVAAWLYAGKIELIPKFVLVEMEHNDLKISPVVALELQYLFEIGRVTKPGIDVIQYLTKNLELSICDIPFEDVIKNSLKQNWTSDPFDRIITAQAAINFSVLVTKDPIIQKNYKKVLWK